ncbi:AAA family ATPase [Streptococcus mitis]|uniref:AAA family ATPase n=1 Tax=Streptococcus mitis TaxID=28037 RepID=UPI001E359AE2|nr:AAA family ATPase [Streptococcus mitis]MCC0092772.1 ATP-binding protein [Streptococcus mitis]
MPLIEKFKINNLYNYYDVELDFKNDKTIYIGENGIGKTTILAMLYYLLDLNYKKLKSFVFDSIEITFEGEEQLQITKKEITQINIQNSNHITSNIKRELFDLVERIKQNQDLVSDLSGLDKSKNLKFDEVSSIYDRYHLLQKYPLQMIVVMLPEVLSRVVPSGYMKLILRIEDFKNRYKILYFPTYRRIEEDLKEFNIISREEPGIRTFNNKSSGELIHFGMEDVEEKIDSLLNKISKETNKSYDVMISRLLELFANANKGKDVPSKDFDSHKVEIALSRLGEKITDETKSNILDRIKNGELHSDVYLNYLVMSIIDNYKVLENIDSKINEFTERVNKYFFGKKYFYNPQLLELGIKRTNNKGESTESFIKLRNLSSGEKQLISTFSKIFLEDEKDLIILFDEPEISLSVPWQEEFIYDISQAQKCAFLVAVTHSPFIYSNMLDYAEEIDKYIVESKQIHKNEIMFQLENEGNDGFPF